MTSLRVLRLDGVGPDDERRWQELATAALEPNPMMEPASVLAAASHDAAFARQTRLLVVADGDRFLAVLPVRTADRWHRLPVPLLTTRLDADPVPLFPVLGTPLVVADRPVDAFTTLLSGLRAGAAGGLRPWLVVLERLAVGGPVSAAWSEACRVLGLPVATSDPYRRPLLELGRAEVAGADAGEWPDVLGAKRLREARRRAARLEEKLGGPLRCVDRTDDPAAVDDLMALEAAGWKGAAGTALRCRPCQEAGFRDLCRRAAAAGGLSLLGLEAGGVTVAMWCAVRSGTGAFVYRIVYDEVFGRYGPGVLLGLAAVDHFRQRGDVQVVDSCCSPTNTFYPDFFPGRLELVTATAALRPPGRAALASAPLLRRAALAARRGTGTARRALASGRQVPESGAPAAGRPG